MAEYRRSEIVSGLFILLAVAVFGVFAFQIGGMNFAKIFGSKRTECVTILPDVKTLEEGVKVTIGGQRVGRVKTISLCSAEDFSRFWSTVVPEESQRPDWARGENVTRQAMRVEFELDRGRSIQIHMPTASVTLATDGFLGTHFLRLDAGDVSKGRPADKEDGVLSIRPESSGGLDDFLSDGRKLMARASSIFEKIETQLLSQANIDRINTILADVQATMGSAKEFAKELPRYVNPEHEGSLDRRLIKPAQDLLVNMNSSLDELRNRLLLATIPKAEGAIDEGKTLLGDGRVLVADLRRDLDQVSNQVQAILADVKVTTGNLETRIDAVQQDLQKLLRSAEKAASDADAILVDNRPEIAETLQAIRRMTWEFEVLSRKLRANPAVLLWGDDEPVFNPAPVDESTLRRSGRARPFGQREETDGKN